MEPIIFIYSHDNIFASVKQEASHLAERKFAENGDSLFEMLVFDEEYLIKFREVFFEAQAEVTPVLSAYIRDVPIQSEWFEEQDFTQNRDYTITLLMPEDWNFHLSRPLNSKIKEFMVAYIMYRWLETKLTDISVIYYQRTNTLLEGIKGLLNKRKKPLRHSYGYWEIS